MSYRPTHRTRLTYSQRRSARARAEAAASLTLLVTHVVLPLLAVALAYEMLVPMVSHIGQSLSTALLP